MLLELDEIRRRDMQVGYNEEHGITPETIRKSVEEILHATAIADIKAHHDEKQAAKEKDRLVAEPILRYMTKERRQELIKQLCSEMM